MSTFKGRISVDDIDIFVRHNDSAAIIDCIKIANELTRCNFGTFVSSIAWERDQDEVDHQGVAPNSMFVKIEGRAENLSLAIMYISKKVFDGNVKIRVDK